MACSNCQSVLPKPNDWVKGKLVGTGSFGTVNLAMNKSTGGLFVVKSAHIGAGCEALSNEVKILESLSSSPYIVQYLGTEKHQGNLNVFMEYMAGGSLADVAQKFGGSLDEEVVRLYTREILHGLQHLHQHGIVHCDLKCKNVLLGSSGNIKLADFGCAKRLDVSADIWSLGCTVIEMATGRYPWAGEVSNPVASVLRIANGDEIPQLPTHFSKEGLDFLTRCLERDPQKRFTAEELLHHPFLSRSSRRSCQQRQYAFSPTSVFEVHDFEDTCDVDDDDELESSRGHEKFSIRNSFSRHDRPVGITAWQQEDSTLWSSGSWITVRSG
ncbi:hypothetical protein PIB30_003831 [Stylosanthes scabra]|uniref:Protein kinase domain-containing protein n=1 Tax=Stylosanthes scabra TaxID=79078 RepID=A0ABU6T328_9FABA|nr:hypothetical protein [Stylosanthes scabra]